MKGKLKPEELNHIEQDISNGKAQRISIQKDADAKRKRRKSSLASAIDELRKQREKMLKKKQEKAENEKEFRKKNAAKFQVKIR